MVNRAPLNPHQILGLICRVQMGSIMVLKEYKIDSENSLCNAGVLGILDILTIEPYFKLFQKMKM